MKSLVVFLLYFLCLVGVAANHYQQCSVEEELTSSPIKAKTMDTEEDTDDDAIALSIDQVSSEIDEPFTVVGIVAEANAIIVPTARIIIPPPDAA